MAERPVVDLLVKLSTDFNAALGEFNKVEETIKRVSAAIKELEEKRIVIPFDVSRLIKGAVDVEGRVKAMSRMIDKLAKGEKLAPAEIKQLEEMSKEAEVAARVMKKGFDDSRKEVEKLTTKLDLAKLQLERQKQAAIDKKKAMEDLGRVETAALKEPVKQITEKAKKFMDLKAQYEEVEKAAKVTGMSYKEAAKAGLLERDTMIDQRETLDGLEAEFRRLGAALGDKKVAGTVANEAQKMIASWNAMTRAQRTEAGMTLQQVDAARTVVSAHNQVDSTIKKVVHRSKTLTSFLDKMAKEGPPAFEKVAKGAWSFWDMMRFWRVAKLPIMAELTKKMPVEFKEGLEKVSKAFPHLSSDATKAFANITHAFGVAQTYTGQFDKRMRYLSRDIYIFGLYARQLSQAYQRSFNQIAKASGDLEMAVEDIGIAWQDFWEPIGDIIAPVFERIAETIEWFTDLLDESPVLTFIGVMVLLGGVFAKIIAPLLRLASVLNLFFRSSLPIIQQQRELAAAQNEHIAQMVHLGMQYEMQQQRIEGLKDSQMTNAQVQAKFNEYMKEQFTMINDVRREMVRFGGDTTKMLEAWARGIQIAREMMKLGLIDREALIMDEKYLAEILKMFGITESEMLAMQEKTKAPGFWDRLKGSMSDLFKALTFRVKAAAKPLGEITEEMEQHIQVAGEEQKAKVKIIKAVKVESKEKKIIARRMKDVNKQTRRGTTSIIGSAAALVTFGVSAAFASAFLEELAPFFDVLADVAATLMELLEPLIDFVTMLAERFSDFLEGLPDVGKIGLVIGTLLGGKVIQELVGKAGAKIAAKYGAGMLGALKGLGSLIWAGLSNPYVLAVLIIIAAIALIWKAWKENWGNIRGHWKNFCEWLGKTWDAVAKRIEGFIRWLSDVWDKTIGKILKAGAAAPRAPAPIAPPAGTVPFMQAGGLVTRAGLAFLHPGELIAPAPIARDLSRSSIVNHIYVTVHIDKSVSERVDDYHVGRIVSEEIAKQLRRRL